MPALRALWAALVDLYDETLAMVVANLLWLALNLPLYALLVLVLIPLGGLIVPEDVSPEWPLLIAAWLLAYLPTPSSVALAGLARAATGPDVPRTSTFWDTLRTRWRLALGCSAVSLVVGAALIGNAYFYAVLTTGWLRFASILWLYGTLFWFGIHVYLVPLAVHVAEPRVFDLYRRAAFITLGHPGYTLLLVIELAVVGLISIILLPAYALLGGAFIGLVQAHALREVRRRHGDLVEEESA
jgi:uncharacterized membrane protein YesL